MKVLVACEFSGRVRDAFRALGHDAVSVDVVDSETYGPHIKADVLSVLDDGWDMLIGFPPCDCLAVSGARWFGAKKRQQVKAIDFVRRLMDAPIHYIAIENPIGVLSTRLRKPDQIIQPWMFGHGETKATCLWLKNLPALAPTDVVSGREPRVWREGPGKNRKRNRSITYTGIALAMASQWGNLPSPPK